MTEDNSQKRLSVYIYIYIYIYIFLVQNIMGLGYCSTLGDLRALLRQISGYAM